MIDEPNYDDLETDVREVRYTALVLKTVLDDAIGHPLKGPFGSSNGSLLVTETEAERNLLAYARSGYKLFVLTPDQWECLDHMACESIKKATELSEKYDACLLGEKEDAPSEGADPIKLN